MRSVVGFLGLMLVMIACAACGPAHGASGSSVVRSAAANPHSSQSDVPETLAAATAAAQGNIDHFTAGDFADVWEHMERAVRQEISKADFVTFYQTCKKPGPRLRVNGVRMDTGDRAIVLVKVHDIERSRTMVYEDGQWNMQATEDFAEHLGQPVAQIVAEETAAGLCIR